jgi:polyphosphate glucokinase
MILHRRRSAIKRPYTLAIDIGGSGLKALVLDRAGASMTDRVRVETPRPATPRAVLAALVELVEPLGAFDRISVGFPGVVFQGTTKTAPNLDPSWAGVPLGDRLAKLLGKPARVLNDAGVQGFGVIEGRGLEMVLTLGTGLGCALFYEGTYIPNLELAHHPFHKGKTYEEYLGARALKRSGAKKWSRHVARAIAQIDPVWNPDRIYLGGGNTHHLKVDLPPHVRITSNVAGLLGGIALWEGREGLQLAKVEKATKAVARQGGRASSSKRRS